MANIPNAPGMPAENPSAADIARYNTWAAAYGQPLWGQNAPVAPAANVQVGRGWRRGVPRGAPPPAPHGVQAEGH